MPDIIYQIGAQVSYFWKVSKHFEKINFRTFFSDSEVQELGFRGSAAHLEILEKSEKNRKSVRGWRTNGGNHPKPIFWSLGGPCGQNEPYTNLVRPFSMKLCFCEVGPFLADFLEISFWSICVSVISREKNIIF